MTVAEGFQAKCGIDVSNPVTVAFDFKGESLKCRQEILDATGLRGTREWDIARCRDGRKHIGGGITLQPNKAEMKALLPWILGGAVSGSGPFTYPLAESLTSRYVAIDRSQAGVFLYSGVYVDTATFRASEGQNLTVELGLIGQDETPGSVGTFPAITVDATDGPWIFEDLILSIGGTGYKCKDFELTISNMVMARFLNSITASTCVAQDSKKTFTTHLPAGDAAAVYGSAGAAGAAVVATFTNSITSEALGISLVKVAFPKDSPVATGRDEIILPVSGDCKKSGGTASVVFTLSA